MMQKWKYLPRAKYDHFQVHTIKYVYGHVHGHR